MSPDARAAIRDARKAALAPSARPGGDDPEARAARDEAWRSDYFAKLSREEIKPYAYTEPRTAP